MTAPPLLAWMYVLGSVIVAWASHRLFVHRLLVASGLRMQRLMWACAALFPLGMTQLLWMRHVPRLVAAPIMWLAFGWVGVVYFLLLACIVFDVIRWVLRPHAQARQRLARHSVAGALTAALLEVTQAQAGPELVRVSMPVRAALSGYRIVQLSDIHIGPTLGATFARQITERVNALHPDLIVITGDLVDGSVPELASEVAPLAALQANDGVVFALGNHEYLSGVDAWIEHLEGLGWRVLRNKRLALPRLDVVGVDDEQPNLAQALAGHSEQKPTLVIAHEPSVFAEACQAGIDVALAGHMHGGQLFPLGVLAWLDQGYVAGRYTCGSTELYVSSGTGYWGPPMRLGTRAEITLLELAASSHLEQ